MNRTLLILVKSRSRKLRGTHQAPCLHLVAHACAHICIYLYLSQVCQSSQFKILTTWMAFSAWEIVIRIVTWSRGWEGRPHGRMGYNGMAGEVMEVRQTQPETKGNEGISGSPWNKEMGMYKGWECNKPLLCDWVQLTEATKHEKLYLDSYNTYVGVHLDFLLPLCFLKTSTNLALFLC